MIKQPREAYDTSFCFLFLDLFIVNVLEKPEVPVWGNQQIMCLAAVYCTCTIHRIAGMQCLLKMTCRSSKSAVSDKC